MNRDNQRSREAIAPAIYPTVIAEDRNGEVAGAALEAFERADAFLLAAKTRPTEYCLGDLIGPDCPCRECVEGRLS